MSYIIIYSTETDQSKLEVILDDETTLFRQKQTSELYNKSESTISEYIKNILDAEELHLEASIRKFRAVQLDKTQTVTKVAIR
ncbi:hypothetical protein [Nitratifractor sp.]|uniref:hypothetical protein n=1 Tax=Nitratifractor sp. TaxID=2268144 RepID=UPI0025E6A7E0|nr:hypothetical protein [Nitratifractor sp.]